MIKKLFAGAAGAALFLSLAVPAFASTTIKNKAKVKNTVTTSANTGGNVITADGDVTGGKIKTGKADAAAFVSNDVNHNTVDCTCDGSLTIKNKAKVKNTVTTSANTGGNVITADGDVTGGKIKTGEADAASIVTNTVNTNVVGTP